MSQTFDFENLVELCRRTHEETQRSAARTVDSSLVVRNYLFGWYIVEYEQHGADRAEYGAQTLRTLSSVLKAKIGRGFSVDALERMRRFYLLYGHILSENPAQEKSATLLRISGDRAISATALRKLSDPLMELPEIVQTLSAQLVNFDRYVKTDDELPTIGIVLCGRKNDAVVELTLPEEANIYASKYQLYLPSKQELVAQLESIQRELNYRGDEEDE
ncbi:MAG: PDDEXK nuclease domain-containing protein [Gemmatimonadetes bacterium]|nr:PDDEXK nuclease domain-containing protein [Gemmatimonadota bacterium]